MIAVLLTTTDASKRLETFRERWDGRMPLDVQIAPRHRIHKIGCWWAHYDAWKLSVEPLMVMEDDYDPRTTPLIVTPQEGFCVFIAPCTQAYFVWNPQGLAEFIGPPDGRHLCEVLGNHIQRRPRSALRAAVRPSPASRLL